MACWAYSYDELAAGPTCATGFWPATYDELITGAPANDPVWPGCTWPTDYDTLITGPVCQTVPELPVFDNWIPCPTQWARVLTGGAWHLPIEDRLVGLIAGPLMHDCHLPWGHGGEHVCLCEREKIKPGEEGLVAPPKETVDPPIFGRLPASELPTIPGGPVAAMLQPPLVKASTDGLGGWLDSLPPD